jgi:hypothetical protein
VPAASVAQTIAITGGTVYPVSDQARQRDGADPRRQSRGGRDQRDHSGRCRGVDVTGKWVTPGLIHANANAGPGVAGLNGLGEETSGGDLNPRLIPRGAGSGGVHDSSRANRGITSAILLPGGPFFRDRRPPWTISAIVSKTC